MWLPVSIISQISLYFTISVNISTIKSNQSNIYLSQQYQFYSNTFILEIINIFYIKQLMNNIINTEQSDQRIYYNLLKRVGAYGQYQINLLRIIYVICFLSSSTFFVVPFLFYQQAYICPNYEGDCTLMVCSLPESQRSQYLPTPLIKSLANQNADMHCDNADDLIVMQEMFLIGTTIGLFIGVIFVQLLGKRLLICISLILIFISLIMLYIQLTYIKAVGLFIWGMGSQVSYSILMAFITQQVIEQQRLQKYTLATFWFMLGTLFDLIIFFIFKDWKLALALYFIPAYFIISAFFIYYVEDSPLDIIERKDSQDAFDAFMRIAKANSIQDHGLTIDQIKQLQQQYRQNQCKNHSYNFSFFDLIKYPSIRGDFLILSFIFFICIFQYYGPSFLLDQLKMNIFALSFINVGSQFIAYSFARVIIKNYPRKKSLIILFSFATVLSFITYLLAPTDCFNCNHSLKLFFTLFVFFEYRICINTCSMVCGSSNSESFPAQVRSLSIYGIVGIGRIATVLIPYQTKFKQISGLPLLLQFSILCLLGIIGAALMKQTWGTLPQQIVLQLRGQKRNE